MPDGTDGQAVFWDIGGVILAIDSVQTAHREFVETLCTEYESPHDPDTAIERWRAEVSSYFAERDGTTFRPAREAYRIASDEILAVDLAETTWRDTFRRILDERAEPNDDALTAIRQLAETPVHQGIVSDVDQDEGERLLELFGVLEHVDSFTSSEEVGRTKPDQAMFETAIEKAGVAPDRSVMIGDRYEHDMVGGSEAGMYTIAYGADDGEAVDRRVDDLRELPAMLGFEE